MKVMEGGMEGGREGGRESGRRVVQGEGGRSEQVYLQKAVVVAPIGQGTSIEDEGWCYIEGR